MALTPIRSSPTRTVRERSPGCSPTTRAPSATWRSSTPARTVDHLKFDSFGNITAQSNSAFQPLFAFQGMLLVPETGLYYDHARWYDPHAGRWLSQDPAGFGAGDPNLYRYVTNSPTDFIDATGLQQQGGAPALPAMPNPQEFFTPEAFGAAYNLFYMPQMAAGIRAAYEKSGANPNPQNAAVDPSSIANTLRFLNAADEMAGAV